MCIIKSYIVKHRTNTKQNKGRHNKEVQNIYIIKQQKGQENMEELNIVYKPIKELKPYKKNAKKHSKEQVEQIANSIKEFGFTQPVIVANREENKNDEI